MKNSRRRNKIMIPLTIILAIVVVFLIIVALQPADFRITRSATIAAPPANVFANVSDFHNWDAWSPWAKLEPNAKKTFDGTPGEVGSAFGWSGNKKIGEGRMTLTDARAAEFLRMRLEFLRPFKATNTAEFAFAPAGERRTNVTWSMSGRKNFMFKAVCLFMNQDKMIGGDFEKGLAQLKNVVESNNTNRNTNRGQS